MMSAWHDSVANSVPRSKVKSLHDIRRRGYGSFGSESASTLVCHTYGDTVVDAAPGVGSSAPSGLADDDDDWNLSDIPLSRNATVRTSLHVDFTAIQTLCPNLSPAVPYKTGDVFGLTLRGSTRCKSLGKLGRRSKLRKQPGKRIWRELMRCRAMRASCSKILGDLNTNWLQLGLSRRAMKPVKWIA